MTAYLRLVRIQNLLIIAITQYLMRFAIINPILKIYDFSLQLSELNFVILVISTICLTAAGYVINDYFDTKTDLLNRPRRVVVGHSISRRSAMALHIILNIMGILGGFWVSWQIGHIKFGFIYVLVSGLLWYYSTTYKRQFLIGNLIVAFLTAMVPALVVLYEVPQLNDAYADLMIENGINLNPLTLWVMAFSFFAFFITLIREIIKDTEDFEGDKEYGRNTLPIVLGTFYTKIIVIVLTSVILLGIAIIYIKYLQGSLYTTIYLSVGLFIPLLFLIYKVIVAKTKNDYTIISGLIKIIMLLGLLYSLVAAYTFSNL